MANEFVLSGGALSVSVLFFYFMIKNIQNVRKRKREEKNDS
jgi:hypothetical protein